jgi:hypothetical protein
MGIKKRISLLFLFFIFNMLYGQSSEYAYLVKTEIINNYRMSGELEINSDLGFIGEVHYKETTLNIGKFYYDFFYIPNSFSEINFFMDDNKNPDCDTSPSVQNLKKIEFDNGITGYFSFINCNYEYFLYPLHIIETPSRADNNACARNTLELSGGYDWQYYIGNNTNPSDDQWKDYASAVTNISVNVGDLYAAEGLNIVDLAPAAPERSLKIRTGHKASDKFVSAKTYQVSGCSPEFKGYYNKTKTSCVYNNDGRVSLNFGSDIDTATAEKLVITLFKEDLVHGSIVIDQNATITNLVDNGGSKYGFVWPSDIDKGKYFFKYQSINTSTNLPDPLPDADDNYWKSLEETPVFEIMPAKNVNFTATKFSNETCVGAKNGKIKLDITSGETSKYKYIIYEVNGTSVTLYRDWTTFTGPTTIIDNLEKKTEYRIKVQDTKKCFARK